MPTDSHVLESLPAYVLGSLEEEEARAVAEHVTGCYLCRNELQALQKVVDQVGLAAPEALPPADLKPRLMERIQSLNAKRAPVSAPRPLRLRLLPAGMLAGLLLIALLALSNLMLWQRLSDLEVLTGPHGMRAVALQSTDAAPGASGFVIVSADGLHGVLVVDELPPLQAANEYQLWLERDSSSVSGAVFSVDESGYRGVRITAPDSLLTYSAVKVTIEPAGGSIDPTGKQVLKGSLFNP